MYAVFFIFLIVTSAFLSISEISLASAKRIRLQTYADEGSEKAKRVLQLQEHPGSFFTVVQIGLNIVALAGGIVGDKLFTPFFAEIMGFAYDGDVAKPAFWVGFATATLCFVMFADLIPKRVALIAPEKIAMNIIKPFNMLIVALKPCIWCLSGIADFFIRALGLPLKSTDKITSEDIIATVDAGTAAGILDSNEQTAIENIFGMESRTVASAMTPREDIAYLLIDADEDEIRHKVTMTPYSRYVVCDKKLDNVVGMVDSKDLLNRLMSNQSINLRDEGLVYPALIVPDSLTLSEILESFRKQRSSIAVIINEYALVVGLISINDVMSTVMGGLVPVDSEDEQIISREDGSWLVMGVTPIDDVEKLIECDELPEDSTYETLAGFMMYMLRRVPRRGDKVVYAGYRFEVVDVDNNRIDQVIISRVAPKTQVKALEKPEPKS